MLCHMDGRGTDGTRGGAGSCLLYTSYLSSEKAAARAVCPRVTPVDTTGAGDIFGGSAVAWLLKSGKAPEELDEKELAAMGAFASAAASLSTETPGGIPSIPSEEAVLKKLRGSETV